MLQYRITSDIPGRVRIQFLNGARLNGGLGRLAAEFESAPNVHEVDCAPEGRSLTVRYTPGMWSLEDLVRQVERETGAIAVRALPDTRPAQKGRPQVAAATRPVAGRASTPRSEPWLSVVHAFPGRLRLLLRRGSGYSAAVVLLEAALASHPGESSVEACNDNRHVIVRYDPKRHHPRSILSRLEWGLVQVIRPVPSPDTIRCAKDLPADAAIGISPLVFPSLAIAAAVTGFLPVAVTGGVLAIASLPLVASAWEGARIRKFNVAQLDLAAISVLSALGDFLTGGIMTWLIGLGEMIRARTTRRSRRAISELMSVETQRAWVKCAAGSVVSVSVSSLRPGDLVYVYPGDQIPVDGVVSEGRALVDQKLLTGESAPITKEPGDPVYALTLVTDGQLTVQVEHMGTETRAGRVAEMIDNAPLSDTRISNFAAKVGDRLVGPIFVVAGVAYLFTGDALRAASILILDFVTGIRVSAPTTILSAMTGAASQGLFIKGGRAMEKLGEVDAIVFDKTGTLTRGEPKVTGVCSLQPHISEDELLRLAACAEANLKHPAARAIVDAAQLRGLEVTSCTEMQYSLGLGVSALVHGRRVLVGSGRFLREMGVGASDAEETAAQYYQDGCSVVFVAVDELLIGLLAYSDPPRAESRLVIQSLRARGVKRIVMLTGDNERAARRVAAELGITDVVAEALPEQKAEVVESLRAAGYCVAVVGDGINDSPAFTRADVSISFQHGSDVARETADVILLDGDLRGLPRAIDLAHSALRILQQNVNIIIAPTAVGIGAAIVGLSTPLISTLINNGTTVITALNALRPLWTRPPDDVPLAGPVSENSL